MLTSAASWKPWVPISTDSHLFRRPSKAGISWNTGLFPFLYFSVPAFLYLLPCLVMLIWVDGFLGVVCWGVGYREPAGGCMLDDDCRGLHEHVARTILVVVVSGGLCAVWSFDSGSGLLMIVGEWPFPRGLKVMSVLVMAGPVAHDSGIVPSCRVVCGVVPRIAVELIWPAIRVMRWND